MTRGRAAAMGLVALVALGLAIDLWARGPGDVRWAGVALRWWYAAVAAPVVGGVLVVTCVGRHAMGRPTLAVPVAAAPSVLVVALGARVFSGAPEALPLALGAVLGPMLGLVLAAARSEGGASRAWGGTALAWAALAGAEACLAADVARALGASAAVAVAAAAGLALAGAGLARSVHGPAAASAVGALLLLGATVLVVSSGTAPAREVAELRTTGAEAPWRVWAEVARRDDPRFGAASPWVTRGGQLAAGGELVASQATSVTHVGGPAGYLLKSTDGPVTLEQPWSPAPGETVHLRRGDALRVPPGASVRFAFDARVPGAPPGGARWASPPRRAEPVQAARAIGLAAAAFLGTAGFVAASVVPGAGFRSTVSSGASQAVSSATSRAVSSAAARAVSSAAARAAVLGAVLVSWVVALAGVIWGVRAALHAPEAGLAGLLSAPALAGLGPVTAGIGPVAVGLGLAGLGALAAASVARLSGSLAWGGWLARSVALVAGAGLLGLWPRQAWPVALAGLALGGCLAVTREPAGRVVGALGLAACLAVASWLPARETAQLTAAPGTGLEWAALPAVALAFVAGRVATRRRGRRADAQAP